MNAVGEVLSRTFFIPLCGLSNYHRKVILIRIANYNPRSSDLDFFCPVELSGSMHPIQESNGSKVHPKLLMVQVMQPCPTEEVITTMHRRRLDEFYGEETPPGEYVHMEELGWQRHGRNVGNEMLQGMSILGCQSDRCGEFVVEFVNVRIQGREMQEEMGIVKHGLSHDDAYKEVLCKLLQRRWTWRKTVLQRFVAPKTDH